MSEEKALVAEIIPRQKRTTFFASLSLNISKSHGGATHGDLARAGRLLPTFFSQAERRGNLSRTRWSWTTSCFGFAEEEKTGAVIFGRIPATIADWAKPQWPSSPDFLECRRHLDEAPPLVLSYVIGIYFFTSRNRHESSQ